MLLAPGAVAVRIGEGRTAEVLRNLCLSVYEEGREDWDRLVGHIHELFGVDIAPPRYRTDRGEITMAYRNGDLVLDISSAGRGLHQALLLLSFMYGRPGSVLLLDEPDAHLEPLRQRQVYRMIREVARESGSQVVMATHSEIFLNEAAGEDLAVAFVGRPHRIGRKDRKRAIQALREIGLEHCVHAEQTGSVLYLNGPADLATLQAFASRLGHREAIKALRRPFVRYVSNSVSACERHFVALAAVVPEIRGCALLDCPSASARDAPGVLGITILRWSKGTVNDYVLNQGTLEAYAARDDRAKAAGPLFAADRADMRVRAMRKAIAAVEPLPGRQPDGLQRSDGRWIALDSVFHRYREDVVVEDGTPQPTAGDLVAVLPESEIDQEIREKLDVVAALGVRDAQVGPR